MEGLKRLIRKYGGHKLQNLIIWFLRVTRFNNRIILFSLKKAKKNRVNVNYWSGVKNIGDAISPVVVSFMAVRNNIDVHRPVRKTKHLYAVGSVITAGCQDCTVWGSGLLNTQVLSRLNKRKLDIRSVRGPLTRIVLMEHGYEVPLNYGDPAILMPLIYDPEVRKKYDVSLITHMNESVDNIGEKYHQISIAFCPRRRPRRRWRRPQQQS